ncbi:MAG: aminoglycoside phosphotransferase family protein, partial [Candidatus Omnitrophica bacterium]|nr:aminoglycoside phosphotransferase family protein [Candidatus Omnitrophota bacterium]
TRINRIDMQPIEGGYSGSSVAAVKFRSKNDEELGVKGVVKVSKSLNTKTELENYNKYVKWFLPYSWRVDVLGLGFTDKYGSVCYSFVNNDGLGAITLTELIKCGKANESIEYAINTLFNPDSKTWYGHIRSGLNDDVSEYYSRYPYVGNSERMLDLDESLYSQLKKIANNESYSCQKENEKMFIDKYDITLPAYLLFSQNWGKYTECICHGDLNSGNIMCDKSLTRIAFIDFQNTGYAHVFLDFISLESSIRIYYPHNKNIDGKLNLLKMIDDEYKSLCKSWNREKIDDEYYECIRIIRLCAHNNFLNEEFRLYVYGSIVVHLWLLRMGKWTDIQCYRLISLILAALKWLDENKNIS